MYTKDKLKDGGERKIFAILFDLEMFVEALSELDRAKKGDDEDGNPTADIEQLKEQARTANTNIQKIVRMQNYLKSDTVQKSDDKNYIRAALVRLTNLC